MAGKKDSYVEDYGKYYPLVYSAVHTKVENHDDTEDICQNVFVSLFEKYEEVKDTRKWLYGALRIAVIEYYRSKKGIEVPFEDEADKVGLTFVNGMRDARIIIKEAIDNIEEFGDETDRLIFDLVAVYNFGYTETAKQLGLTYRTVEYRYGRMVQSINDYLKSRGIKSLEDIL